MKIKTIITLFIVDCINKCSMQ